MSRLISIAAFAVLAALPQAFAGNLLVDNSCEFSIFCAGAKNDGTFTEVVEVGGGEVLQSLKPANNDNIGAVLKCGLDNTLQNVYQMEMAVRDGKTWLDLSSLDGSPFVAYRRRAEIPGTTCALDCQAGQTNCEWPTSVDCISDGDAILTLCG
ncbi:hypothetical protein F5Y14DRAFT_263783 [Nemania sp. NC0429]|nr:hypothetical protein F5Y14DRAFT_263783 [Nemania sp. NC0429]